MGHFMMIFTYDHRGIIMTDRVPCGTSVTAAYYRDWVQELCRKCTKTELTCSGMGHSFCTTTHARTWRRLWPICWVNTSGKCYLTRHTVQTWVHRTWLISLVKRAHAWTPFFLPGRGFCSGYPSHPKTEQKWHPKWNRKSPEALGRCHWEAGGLQRRIVKRYCLK